MLLPTLALRMASCFVSEKVTMKIVVKSLLSIAIPVFSVGCADPSVLAPPINENPKPLTLYIAPSHIAESYAEGEFLPNGERTFKISVTVEPHDSSYVVVDTAAQRVVKLRLRLRPDLTRPGDTSRTFLESILIELDTSQALMFNRERLTLSRGEARFVLRRKDGGLIVYQTYPVDRISPAVPADWRDDVYCRMRAWRIGEQNERSVLVLQLELQHYILEQQPHGVHRLRSQIECRVPLG